MSRALVERALGADGSVPRTKTGAVRSVPIHASLREDLKAWRDVSPAAGDGDWMFPTSAGEAWPEDHWRNWRRRVFGAVADVCGATGARPYDLRHSAASLWLHEGRSVVEVASWLGHSGQMCLSTYAHVMADLGGKRVSAETSIRKARKKAVPLSYPRAGSKAAAMGGKHAPKPSRRADSNR